jgi:predicted RNase H-related nuclease YkuK (DUF458 family)
MKPWLDADGNQTTNEDIFVVLKPYVENGGKIYIGADSMLYSAKCSFACVIALHDTNQRISKYFYKRYSEEATLYKNLQVKILNEVSLAISAAQEILELFPDADIEIHVDIGIGSKNKTRTMIDQVRGWILGSGFNFQIKPKSWASSSIADWHTK